MNYNSWFQQADGSWKVRLAGQQSCVASRPLFEAGDHVAYTDGREGIVNVDGSVTITATAAMLAPVGGYVSSQKVRRV